SYTNIARMRLEDTFVSSNRILVFRGVFRYSPFYYTFSNYAIKRFIETARFMVTEHFIAINRYMQITAYFAFIDFNLRSKR
ncbi:hypothetical protein, partial [Veillonella sp.]|uniref:hypothetical protein n=1 Tax=Veillonella sp. TaxID=1926307 RepID=UPI0025CC44E8